MRTCPQIRLRIEFAKCLGSLRIALQSSLSMHRPFSLEIRKNIKQLVNYVLLNRELAGSTEDPWSKQSTLFETFGEGGGLATRL